MPFPCFDLCLTAWRESEIVFHGTVVGAVILDFFAMGVFFDDLGVDAFLFGIVTIISLTDFDLAGWNTGRRLIALPACTAAFALLCARELVHAVDPLRAGGASLRAAGAALAGWCLHCWGLCCALAGLLLGLIARESWADAGSACCWAKAGSARAGDGAGCAHGCCCLDWNLVHDGGLLVLRGCSVKAGEENQLCKLGIL